MAKNNGFLALIGFSLAAAGYLVYNRIKSQAAAAAPTSPALNPSISVTNSPANGAIDTATLIDTALKTAIPNNTPVATVKLVTNTQDNVGDLVTFGGDVAKGFAKAGPVGAIGGAAVALVHNLGDVFQGHSSWYIADRDLSHGDWQSFANYVLAFYLRGGLTDKDFTGGISQNAAYNNWKRYTMFPLMYAHTSDPNLIPAWQATYNAGMIATPPPTPYTVS